MAIDINNVNLGPVKGRDGHRPSADTSSNATSSKTAGAEVQVDQVDLSADAQSLQRVEKQLESQESFDQQKVEQIKQALAKGEYPIDNERLASKFFELENQLNQ
ncbi:MAG: flagellar biosynthesis anti-sigma factor FlgM [Pseudomonadota bacterium]